MSAFDELVSSYHDSIGLGKCEITGNACSERESLLAELASLRATVAALTAERDALASFANDVKAATYMPDGSRLSDEVKRIISERDSAYRRGWCDAREAAAGASDKFASATRMKLPAPFGGLHDPDQDGFETASPFVKWTAQSISNAIRALQPPPAPTEHDAAMLEVNSYIRHLLSMSVGDRYNEICKMRDDKDYFLSVLGYDCKPTEHDADEDHRSYAVEAWNELHEFDGVKCQCACVCTRDADRYVDGLPSCEFCAKL